MCSQRSSENLLLVPRISHVLTALIFPPWELLFASKWVTYACDLRVLLPLAVVTGSWTCFLEQPMFVFFFFVVVGFFLLVFFPSLLGFISQLQESCVLPKTALSVDAPCFCKAIQTGTLQIPGAQAWLAACACRATVPGMDLSPFPPSAFLPSPASLPVPGVS